MKKIKLEEKISRKRRYIVLSSLAIGVTFLLAIAQLLLSNHLASFGKELAKLRAEEKELLFTNEVLSKKIAKESSIATVSEKAHNLSFERASAFLVVGQAETVALLR